MSSQSQAILNGTQQSCNNGFIHFTIKLDKFPFNEISCIPRKYHISLGKPSEKCDVKGKRINELGCTLRVN